VSNLEVMDRRQLLTRLENAWQTFQASYTGLSDRELVEPGVTGVWSVRDILAHVSSWEEEALKHLPLILKGEKPPRYSVSYGGIDAFNRLVTERKRSLSLDEVRRQARETHVKLLSFLESVPEREFRTETPFRHRVRLDTYSHYAKHGEAIRRWRKQKR
jgi:hypothetical protein